MSKEIVKRVSAVAQYQGPIPHPEMLAHYDQVCPGFAERIMAMSEREAMTRQELEKKNMQIAENDIVAARRETNRGQWMSFFITLAAFATAGLCAYLDKPWVAGIIGGTTLIGVVSAIMRRDDKTKK